MTALARPDLNALLREVDSFAARAIALGLQHGHLPTDFGDALLAFLRARSLAFAQARRTGIALGRDALGRGVRHAFTCLDLGLEAAAHGDIEAAVEQLTFDNLGPLCRHGYEIAFGRLEEMRNVSRELSGAEQLGLFPDLRDQLDAWSRIVPETWSVHGAHWEPEEVDPHRDYADFQVTAGRAQLLGALPSERLAALFGLPFLAFGDLLRRLAVAAALGLDHLVPGKADVRRFRHQCCRGPCLLPAVRGQITSTVAGYLDQHVTYEPARHTILQELQAELATIESACTDERDLLLCLREDLALAEAEAAAARDAAFDTADPPTHDAITPARKDP